MKTFDINSVKFHDKYCNNSKKDTCHNNGGDTNKGGGDIIRKVNKKVKF